MKKVLLLLLITLIAFSCKKDEELDTFENKLIGTWEYEQVMTYDTTATYLPGNGNLLLIGADGSYERRRNNTIEFKGTYTLQVNKDVCDRETNMVLITNETSSAMYNYVNIENGKLSLSTPCTYVDGGTAYYRRVQE